MLENDTNYLTNRGALTFLESLPDGSSFSITVGGYTFDRTAIAEEIRVESDLAEIFKNDIAQELYRASGVIVPTKNFETDWIEAAIELRKADFSGTKVPEIEPQRTTLLY